MVWGICFDIKGGVQALVDREKKIPGLNSPSYIHAPFWDF
jgi:hypothetical protein